MNTAQMFQIAVRDEEGRSHLFRVQHEDLTSVEQAIAMTKQEFNCATVLCSVPKQ